MSGFGILASLDFLGIDHYNRNGIHKANLQSGELGLLMAFFIYLFSKLFCILKDETVYKCISCGEVFAEYYDNNYRCKICGDGVITIKDYYLDDNIERDIFIPLINDKKDIWKPVKAIHKKENIFKVISENRNPSDETWQYNITDIVKCKIKKFDDDKIGLIAYAKIPDKDFPNNNKNQKIE